jgi:hypothetical protein
MIETKKHKYFDCTVADWLPMNVAELEFDGVSLSKIIANGRDGFGLAGEDLETVVGMCIGVLIDGGAQPVIGGGNTDYFWLLQPQYGTASDEIAHNVIAEWRASGRDPDLGGLWFATPEHYQARSRG